MHERSETREGDETSWRPGQLKQIPWPYLEAAEDIWLITSKALLGQRERLERALSLTSAQMWL